MRRDGESGMVTAETAVVLPVLVLIFASLMGVLAAETTRIRCVDAAGEAARTAATGGSLAEVTAAVHRALPLARVSLSTAGDLVTASIDTPIADLPGPLSGLRVSDSASALVSAGPLVSGTG